MKKCLVFYEKGYEKYASELIGAAEEMYGKETCVCALCVNADPEEAMGFFDIVYRVSDEDIAEYDVRNLSGIIAEMQEKYGFDCILIPATYIGRMLAPRTAVRLRTGLTADVTAIGHEAGEVMMIRPAFSGTIMAGIINPEARPVMMSIRLGVFSFEGARSKQTETVEFVPGKKEESSLRRISRMKKPDSADIRESEILVSAGGGAMNSMELVGKLADRLGGMPAASRRTVDAGLADRSIQVGQSGKTVSPELYIAAGIYGSIQHIAGLNKVKHLIAVNTDPKAPICSLADIVVEGDAAGFIEKLLERIEKGQEKE